eukprot:241912_1
MMETQLANATVLIDEIWTQNSKFRRDKSIKLLTKIYTNIKNNPNDAKFRKLNISKIMSKPNIVSQVRELLLISGFKPNKNGIHIDLDDSNFNLCVSVSNIIANRIIDEENKLEQERQKIKQKTKEKQAKYISKSNRRKNELMTKITNEKKDIAKEKQLGFKVVQHKKNTNIINSNPNTIKTKIIKTKVKNKTLKSRTNSSNQKRSTWIVGSKCEIYLPISHKWVTGRISDIDENNNDILTIKYMGFKTKTYDRNSEYIRAIIKTKSTFIKDPEIMDRWFNIIIEYWWRLSDIYKRKDIYINRMIILYSLNAYRSILTKDTEYYSNQNRQRQLRYNSTNNRDISIKLNRQKQYEDYEREQFYNKLKTSIYKTQNKYSETRLPMPVSGINFKKEYVVLISNKCYGCELISDYEISNDGKCIIFSVYADMVNMMNGNNNINMRRNYMGFINNNIWCVAIPMLFKFEKIGIKTIMKTIKKIKPKVQQRNMIHTHGNPMVMATHPIMPPNYANINNINMNDIVMDNNDNDNDDDMDNDSDMDDYMNTNNDITNIPTEIVEKIIYIDVKSGEIIKSKNDKDIDGNDNEEEQRNNLLLTN